PMKARAQADANPEEDSFAAFLDGERKKLTKDREARKKKATDTFTAASIKEWLFPDAETHPTDAIAFHTREAVEALCGRAQVGAIAGALGNKLRQFRGRVFDVGERRLRLVKDGERAGAARWAIEELGHA